jgi:hypothetical protein
MKGAVPAACCFRLSGTPMPAELRSPFDLSIREHPAEPPPAPSDERLDAEFDLAYEEASEIHPRDAEAPASTDGPAPLTLWGRAAALPWPRIGQFLALQFFIVMLVVVGLPELLPGRPKAQVTVRPVGEETGRAAVIGPRSVSPDLLTVSLMRYGDTARATDGTPLARVPIRALEGKRLEPAPYVVQFEYRGQRVDGGVASIQPGEQIKLRVPTAALADIEYRSGLRHVRQGGDIPYFRRAVRLDPAHVAAHLQLAAYELLRGSPRRARQHLAAVRRKEPGNPYAARISRMLQQRGGREG